MRIFTIILTGTTLISCQTLVSGGGDLFSGENELVYVAPNGTTTVAVPRDAGLKPDECFSVSLAQVALQSVTEPWYLRLNGHVPSGQVGVFLDVLQPSRTLGEPATLALSRQDPGRLVYFDDDARDATYLNIGNIEISRPAKYKGNGLNISSTILEFDDEQFKGYKNNASEIIEISSALSGTGAAVPIVKKATDTFLGQYEHNDVMSSYIGRISNPHPGWYIIWRTSPFKSSFEGNKDPVLSPIGLPFDPSRERITKSWTGLANFGLQPRRNNTYIVLRLDSLSATDCGITEDKYLTKF